VRRLKLGVGLGLGSGGTAAATHFRQVSASSGEYLSTTGVSVPAAGTIIAVINPTAIGSEFGGIFHINSSTKSCWLALVPGSPDTLDLLVRWGSGGSSLRLSVAFASDAALYDGTPKVVWGRWDFATTSAEVGYGDPDDSNTDSGTLGGSPASGSGLPCYIGNINADADRLIAGDFEIAKFDRSLSDAEIQGIVAALHLRTLAPGDADVYPRPAANTPPNTVLTNTATQLQDEVARTYTINTNAGNSAITLVR
jgi:hypothetical protein